MSVLRRTVRTARTVRITPAGDCRDPSDLRLDLEIRTVREPYVACKIPRATLELHSAAAVASNLRYLPITHTHIHTSESVTRINADILGVYTPVQTTSEISLALFLTDRLTRGTCEYLCDTATSNAHVVKRAYFAMDLRMDPLFLSVEHRAGDSAIPSVPSSSTSERCFSLGGKGRRFPTRGATFRDARCKTRFSFQRGATTSIFHTARENTSPAAGLWVLSSAGQRRRRSHRRRRRRRHPLSASVCAAIVTSLHDEVRVVM